MKKYQIQEFFKLRMVELYSKNAIDSNRVRCNNTMSLLYELKEELRNWYRGNIKRIETILLFIDETLTSVKNDEVVDISIMPIEVLNDVITKFKANNNKDKRDEDTSKLFIHYLSILIEGNERSYLERHFALIEDMIFGDDDIDESKDLYPYLIRLDKILISFSYELLRIGYSKIYLYNHFLHILKNENKLEFNDVFKSLRESLTQRKMQNMTVIFRMDFQTEAKQQKVAVLFPELSGDVPQRFIDVTTKDRQKHLQPSPNRFYISHVQALDEAAAVKKVRYELSRILDTRQTGIYLINAQIPYSANVYLELPNGDLRHKFVTAYNMDIKTPGLIEYPQTLVDALEHIRSNDSAQEVVDRLYSALRHLRVGDRQSELEQKFINFWIGLEFIFSSAISGDSTYSRLQQNLKNILSCVYLKRNFSELNFLLQEKGYLNNDEYFWINHLVDFDEFNASVTSLLLWYRLKKVKSLLQTGDAKEKYIKKHEVNLEQHIERLYRLRNRFIHEAALNQDIENVTSNLRSYLVTIINLCIGYFCGRPSAKGLGMNDFFWEFDYWRELMKKKDYSLDVMFKVPDIIYYVK